MARSDLLVSLVTAVASGDRRLMRSTVEAIIAEERSKQHNVLADKLAKAMRDMGNGVQHPHALPAETVHRGRDFIAEVQPQRRLEELILPEPVQTACRQLIEEHHRADVLRAHSLEPRHRALLVGPPGNGKTTLAEGVAEALALPLFVVRYELMIGSYLGETASRLKHLFDYVRTTPCVLFFDEFDVLGKERGDTHETGEIKRVVSSLLLQVDDLPSYTIVIAATNHAELLDRAAWRRFQIRVELPKPTRKQMAAFVATFPRPPKRARRYDCRDPRYATRSGQLRRSRAILSRPVPSTGFGHGRTVSESHCGRAVETLVGPRKRIRTHQGRAELSRAGTSTPENPGA